MDQRDQQTPAPSRRDFIKTSAAVVGGTVAILLATRKDTYPDPSLGKL